MFVGDRIILPLYVEDRPSEVILTVDGLYGVEAADLRIEYDAGEVSITGKRANVEIACGCELATRVDPNRATAVCKSGVLTVRLPKAATDTRRTIKVVG